MKIQPVISDIGSEAFAELVRSFNALLVTLANADTFVAMQGQIADGSTDVVEIELLPNIPPARKLPTHG